MTNRLRRISRHGQTVIVLVIVAVAAVAAWSFVVKQPGRAAVERTTTSGPGQPSQDAFSPTPAQWSTLTVEPVLTNVFRSEHVTEGKIAIDEDRSTLVTSLYSGRIVKLVAKPGDTVTRGQLLFTIEATDMVQAQNDFIAGIVGRNKARSQLSFAEIDERRYEALAKTKAGPQRDFDQAHTAHIAAQNDLRAAETALEAVRNRLRILGKTDDEIATFEQTGKISPETPIYAPIGGIILQRKAGLGQFINNQVGGDPVFIIGDIATVWLVGYVRETDAPRIRVGQQISFTLLGDSRQTYRGNIEYVATMLDASSRRLMIRTTISNPDGALKPEMYASVTIFTEEGDSWPAIPRDAVIYEGSSARVWVAHEDKSIERRAIRPGLIAGRMIQVLEGLQPGENVVTRGSLFIDRAAESALTR